MKYFKVTAKCGHVGGKNKYILIDFYVIAADGKAAAAAVRQAGRVKHDHKDAIRAVHEISFADYTAGKAEFRADPFNNCSNPQEQRKVWDQIAPRVQDETSDDWRIKTERQEKRQNAKRSLRYGYDAWGKHTTKGGWDCCECA